MKHDNSNRWQSGMGVLELLLTLVLVGVLIFLVSAGLGKTRSQALSVQCLSNLKQLNTGMLLYTNDHNGWFPKLAGDEENPNGVGLQWDSLIAPYFGLTADVKGRSQKTVFYCPAAPKNSEKTFGRSYGYNLFMANNLSGSGHSRHIKDPALQLVLMESLYKAADYTISWPLYGGHNNGAHVYQPNPQRIVYPHGKQGYFSFADGHVAAREPTQEVSPGAAVQPRHVIWANGMPVTSPE